MEKSFEIRSYGVGELAALYNPNVHPSTAVRTLRQWIDRYPGLRARLVASGMRPRTRIITPAQVRMIVEALGEP